MNGEVTTPASAMPTAILDMTSFKRRLGFRHRVKRRIVDGEPAEPLPSQMAVSDGQGGFVKYELKNEQEELDFINGVFPTKYRVPALDEDISSLKDYQVRWREAKDEDALVGRHPSQCKFKETRARGEKPASSRLIEVVKEVPCEWTGLQPGDMLGMSLGGSGDYFAFAASRKLHWMGGEVFRIPPFHLQRHRGAGLKDDDDVLLAQLLDTNREEFYPTLIRDRGIIFVRETYKVRMDAMKDRMACAQRLRQRLIGLTFCNEEGGFPDGDIEKSFDEVKANDPIFTAIEKMEAQALKDMTAAVEATEVWQKLFEPLPGVGPAIAARLISVIVDIRRFETEAKLRKYLGAHVKDDGTFPRRRSNEVANWSPDGRQALYLLADQFVKKPDSPWGQVLIGYKLTFRKKHPQICVAVKNSDLGIDDPTGKGVTEVPIGFAPQPKKAKYTATHPVTGEAITVSGPQRYGNGHIHKRAIWRTISLFVRWLHREWWKFDRAAKAAPSVPTDATKAPDASPAPSQPPQGEEGVEGEAKAA